jgi:hypothetical protein
MAAFRSWQLTGRAAGRKSASMSETTHRAGMRRITDPGSRRARAIVIRHTLADDYVDVVFSRCRCS